MFTRAICLLGYFLFLLSNTLYGQTSARISGKIVDASSNSPLPFSTIRIFAESDSTFKWGDLADDQGIFSIENRAGQHYALIEFMGYAPAMISLPAGIESVNLGTIRLKTSAASLQEVVVQGEKSSFELALDKRIFNVGKDLANAGGTAADILNNVPSVSVDAEGNVSLRGSGVRILVDGKPSGMISSKGASGLQQLQGSAIERVEIITNPSARYEAEGMGGIINIILKKEQRQGFNGSFDIITGLPANFGGAANINYRHKDFNFFTNYTLSHRNLLSNVNQYQEVYHNDSTFITRQTWERTYKALHHNLRMGADYYFDEKTTLTAAYTWSNKKGKRYSDIYYYDAKTTAENLFSTTNRTQDEIETEPNSEYALTFKKDFTRKGHSLSAVAQHLDNWESSDQYFGQTTTLATGFPIARPYILQHSINYESEKQWLFQVDYVQPFAKEAKFETGFRSSFRDMTNDYFVAEQTESGDWENLPAFTNDFVYDENIHAVYGMLGNKSGKISYQMGLRGEWSEVTTTLKQSNEVNNRHYVNAFPSAHLTYDLPKQNALQLSYSRRIKRPHYNDLSPFFTFSDNRNYGSGNPDLNPEFTNAFEIGHIKYFSTGTITSSLYYRHTTGKIIQIRTVDSSGYSFTRPENLSTEDAYGVELTGTLTPVNWLKLDGSANFYRANIDGGNLDKSYKSDAYSWIVRTNTRFTIAQNTDFQLRQSYDGPEKHPQGSRKGQYVLDLALSKDILKNKATLTLNVTDVFNSRRFRTTTRGENFYTYNNSMGKVRQINLILMYRLKQAKSNKKSSLENY